MLQNKEKKIYQQEAPCLILDYNVQHKDVAKVVKRHWHILRNDRDLQKILPVRPNIIYRRAPTLRDLMVKSVVEPLPKTGYTFFGGKGFFPL